MKKLTALIFCLALRGEPVNFTKHIAPILFEYCAPCHRPGEAGPFPLLTYDDARKRAAQIVKVTKSRYMPPWLPEPGYGEFEGTRRLSDEQLSLLARWAQSGTPEGDTSALPPSPQFTEGWQLGPPDLILRMRQPYELTATPGDVFRNFVLPVGLKETKYIRAIELRPGNKRLVHHANVIVDRSRMLRKQDGLDGEPGFAGMEVITEGTGEFDPDSHFLFWKPGTVPQPEPADMAWRLDPGSDLIVNLHMQPSGKPETIDAVLGLYFSKEPPTRFPMLLQLEHDGALDIPPEDAHFMVTDHLKLPIAVSVLAVYPHAHYLGKQFEAWAELPDGTRRQLLRVNHWDINWQAKFTYQTPVALPAGTVVAMRITYDNTSRNPRNPNRPTQRVKAGNRSADEMGHVWLQVLPVAAQGEDDPRLRLQQAVMVRRLEKYPADFVAHFNLGAALQALGKHGEAVVYLKRAVAIRPSSATARNNLAASLMMTDNVDESIHQLRQSLALDANYQNARYNLARALVAKGDGVEALAELRTYLAAIPDDVQAQELAGRTCVSIGKLAESLVYFRKAAELEPDDSGIQTNLGAALAMSGLGPEAVEAFEKALKADPANQVARDNLARLKGNQ